MKKLVFTVTNDLSYDQRMRRICSSLANAGYEVTLVGRRLRQSIALSKMPFRQKRLRCLFTKGPAFYAEYNLRLFVYLLFKRADLLCAIDLDTILPVLLVSKVRRKERVYDAHELFCEMKEIVTRPRVYRIWKRIERYSVPQFKYGYTVNAILAAEFNTMYGVNYAVIRNMPLLRELPAVAKTRRTILYQGAVNEGRCFETLIPAMELVDAKLVICGDGNFMEEAKRLAGRKEIGNKVEFAGKVPPDELAAYTVRATIGVTLFDRAGNSNYYSLANRFFDYMHACVPQVCVDFPVYRGIVNTFPVALLTKETNANSLAEHINRLLNDDDLYASMVEACKKAREQLNWQQEEKELLSFYQRIKDARNE